MSKTKKSKKTEQPEKLSYYMRKKLERLKEEKAKARKKKKLAKKEPIKAKVKKAPKKGPVIDKPKVKRPTTRKKAPVEKPAKQAEAVVVPPPVVEEVVVVPVVVKAPPKNIYLNNRDLLQEVKVSKSKGEMSGRLAKMLQLLCNKYAKRGNFVNYSYNEDMQAYAMMMLVRTWDSFDPARSENAFAFFTQCVKSSFIQYLNQEKRQRVIRDLILVDQGYNPSFGFEDGDDHSPDDEQDFHAQRRIAHELHKLPSEELPREEGAEPVEETPTEVDTHPNS